MIVKCISTSSSVDRPDSLHFRWLTLDKIYNVIQCDKDWVTFKIIDDDENISSYPKHCFMDLMVWRQQQIEKVINE
jgi:hypothetical protein